MAVSASDVKALREATGAGMMDCKKDARKSSIKNYSYNVVDYCYTAYSLENRNEQNLKESLSVWHEKSEMTYRLS